MDEPDLHKALGDLSMARAGCHQHRRGSEFWFGPRAGDRPCCARAARSFASSLGAVSLLFHSLPSPSHVSDRKCGFSRHCVLQQPASCLAEANSRFKSLLISLQTMCSDF